MNYLFRVYKFLLLVDMKKIKFILVVGSALFISFIQLGTIAGGSMMISSWYTDRITINDSEMFETLQTKNLLNTNIFKV